jgi:hypothetical protein
MKYNHLPSSSNQIPYSLLTSNQDYIKLPSAFAFSPHNTHLAAVCGDTLTVFYIKEIKKRNKRDFKNNKFDNNKNETDEKLNIKELKFNRHNKLGKIKRR